MTTNFPISLDSFTNPNAVGGDTLASVPHDAQHANINDAVSALEIKVGINNSADTSSLDYKVSHALAIGSAVTSGTPGSVLFLDGSGNLAESSRFTYDGSTLKMLANGTANMLDLASGAVTINYDGTHWATPENLSVGNGATVSGATRGLAVGSRANAIGNVPIAIGPDSNVTGDGGVAIGFSTVTAQLGVSIGVFANSALEAVAIGYGAVASGTQAVAVGQQTTASHLGCCVVGPGSSSFADFEFVSGHYSALGTGMSFRLTGVTSDTIAKTSMFRLVNTFVDAAAATQKVRSSFQVFDTAAREAIRMETDGAQAMLGFLGAPAVPRPSSTDDLRQAFIDLGLYATGGATPLNLNGGDMTAASGTFGNIIITGNVVENVSNPLILAHGTSQKAFIDDSSGTMAINMDGNTGDANFNGTVVAAAFSAGNGASDTFLTFDGKTVTVANGIVTSIV